MGPVNPFRGPKSSQSMNFSQYFAKYIFLLISVLPFLILEIFLSKHESLHIMFWRLTLARLLYLISITVSFG